MSVVRCLLYTTGTLCPWNLNNMIARRRPENDITKILILQWKLNLEDEYHKNEKGEIVYRHSAKDLEIKEYRSLANKNRIHRLMFTISESLVCLLSWLAVWVVDWNFVVVFGLVWFHLVWYGLVWYDLVWGAEYWIRYLKISRIAR